MRLFAFASFAGIASIALFACARPVQPQPAPSGESSSVTPPRPPSAADAGSSVEGGRAKPECFELAWSRTRCARPWTPKNPVNAVEWVTKRGIKVQEGAAIPSKAFEHVNDYTSGCESIVVGSAKEDALACGFGYGTMDGVSIGGFRIITVRKKQIVLLLDVIDSIGTMPVVPDQVDEFPLLFGLDANLEKAEHEIVVAQPSPKACAEANATLTAHGTRSKEEQDALLAAHRWLKKTCDGAKRYVWTKDAFTAAP